MRPPADYAEPVTGTPKTQRDKSPWIPVLVALIVPTLVALLVGYGAIVKLDALADEVDDNGRAIADHPSTFVPRTEIDAKLQTIQVQIGAVQASVESAKEAQEQQSAQIIRKLDRIEDETRRTP